MERRTLIRADVEWTLNDDDDDDTHTHFTHTHYERFPERQIAQSFVPNFPVAQLVCCPIGCTLINDHVKKSTDGDDDAILLHC